MSAPSVTNTFVAGTAAVAAQVNQNFTDIINGVSDGTKDLTIANLTANTAVKLKVTGAGAQLVTLQAPTSIVGSFSLTLPIANPTSVAQVLSADTSGNLSFTQSAALNILGVTDASSASAGVVGEFVDSGAVTTVNGSTGTYVNITSISLTAGDWDVTGYARSELNTGTGMTRNIFAISTNSGNTTTDHVAGYNQLEEYLPTASIDSSSNISNYRVNVSSTTTVYWKYRADFGGGQPRINGARLVARRRR